MQELARADPAEPYVRGTSSTCYRFVGQLRAEQEASNLVREPSDWQAARMALTAALNSPVAFTGKDENRRILTEIT